MPSAPCVRPGHHAEYGRADGVLLLQQHRAMAARHALDVHGLERVAIIDFDVHHGNGTENIVAGDPRILMVSIFQHPFYPYSGAEPMADNLCNVPLPARSRGDVFREAVSTRWLPRLDEFAAADAVHLGRLRRTFEDDMASLGLVEADYAWVSVQLMQVARTHSGQGGASSRCSKGATRCRRSAAASPNMSSALADLKAGSRLQGKTLEHLENHQAGWACPRAPVECRVSC
jgi:acetoin utilization deacetylase AcuC-like enzyme